MVSTPPVTAMIGARLFLRRIGRECDRGYGPVKTFGSPADGDVISLKGGRII
jgi:hypothetical protein